MITITRKIQISFDCDKSELKEKYKQWYGYQRIVHRAANWITNHLYIQDHVKTFHYYTEDVKVKLANATKDEAGILTMSRDNTTYQMLSKAFKGQCPMGMLSGLNMVIAKTYKTESKDVSYGKRALRSYRGNIPMPVRRGDIGNIKKLEDGNYSFFVYGTPFRTYFGKDLSGNELIMDMAIEEKYKWCDSSIQIDDNKFFLLAVFQFEKQDIKIDKRREFTVFLSQEAPLGFTFKGNDYLIGSKEEFQHRLDQIRAGRARAVISARYNKSGRGRNKRMSMVDRYDEYAEHYIQTRVHQYTAKLIDFAIKYKVGRIILAAEPETETVFPGWSYHGLTEKIKYKCAKFGIELHGIDKKTEEKAISERQPVCEDINA